MPWITVGEVTNGVDKYLYSTQNYLTELGSKQSRIIYPETLLLSNSGATSNVTQVLNILDTVTTVLVLLVNPVTFLSKLHEAN
jgi:type I restriction enzyme S subunit